MYCEYLRSSDPPSLSLPFHLFKGEREGGSDDLKYSLYTVLQPVEGSDFIRINKGGGVCVII